MFIRVLSTILIITIVFMGVKQGWAMITGKPEMTQMLGRFHFGRTGIIANGIITLFSAVLILFPRASLAGNFLMAAAILLILCFQLSLKDLKGGFIEIPFLIMNLLAIYLGHPLYKIS